jgi:hypothetical protein
MKVNKAMCATCPWRKDSPYGYLLPELMASACTTASRICHSTGDNAINEHTGIPEAICRGARDEQLGMLHAIGMLPAATDAAWDAMCATLGIVPNVCGKRGDD